jgi:hypothetical protein
MRYEITPSTAQVQDIFGGAYVQEQRTDGAHGSFLDNAVGIEEAIRTLRSAMFDEVLKSLRRALSV